jgi:hypothetical protein
LRERSKRLGRIDDAHALVVLENVRDRAQVEPKSALIWEGRPNGNPAEVTRALLEAAVNGADAVP